MGLYSSKTILILGGKPIGSSDIISYLKENGAYTIVTDYLPAKHSYAKQIADESWDLSTSDVDAICDKIIEDQVDAVFTGVHEANIRMASDICDRLNIPFYTTKEQLIKTSIKSEYKQLFRDFDIPVVPEFALNELTFNGALSKIEYPVLMKPIDGTGGYGISICHDEKELRNGYEKTLNSSAIKKVIAEKFISAKEATIFYVIQNGKIMLSAMADRDTKNGDKHTIPLPVLYTFPSKYLANYLNTLNDKVINAFESIGLKNGMAFIQTFIDDYKFQFYDMGFRLSGTQEYHIIEHLCGYNPLKMMVDYSLTGKMGRENIQPLIDPFFNGKNACIITFLANPCTIGNFVGIGEIKKLQGVIKIVKNYQTGDTIPYSSLGTLNQVVLRVFVVADKNDEMKSLIQIIINKIDILSNDGKSVVMPSINTEEL